MAGQREPVGRGPIYLEHPCDHDFHREDIGGNDHELALLCLLGLEIDLEEGGGRCVEV